MSNLQNRLSYNPYTPQGHEAPLTQMLSARTPGLLNPSHTSCPDPEDVSTDPSGLTERDWRGGMSEPVPSSTVRNGVETGEGLID